jgi:hypothetical protein
LHAALSVDSVPEQMRGLQDALSFFMVARTLPRKYDVGEGAQRYRPLLDAFLEVEARSFVQDDFVKKVDALRKGIGARYGGRDLLSLSTKLLWLKHRDPFIIYDSRASKALGVTSSDYRDFTKKWEVGFLEHQSSIVAISGRLAELLQSGLVSYFLPVTDNLEHEAVRLCSQTWYHRRVFDIYLWHLGG